MSSAGSERYIHLTQEYVHALTLFGRLSAIDWSIIMTVAHHTWGFQRESAELGTATLLERIAGEKETIRRRMSVLSTKAPAGYGLIRVVHAPTATSGRVIALERDWRLWAWPDVESLERCVVAMSSYRESSRSAGSAWVPTATAVGLAELLRETCEGTIPVAEVPPVDLENAQWRRWVQTMETLLKKRDETTMRAIIRFVGRDRYYCTHILGEHADSRLAREIDRIHARMITPRSTRT